jgi:hypothetical protein
MGEVAGASGYAGCASMVAYEPPGVGDGTHAFQQNFQVRKVFAMLANMESDMGDLAAAQRVAERAAAAPYVDYPPTPSWYYPAFGVWVAAYVALLGLREEHPVLLVVGIVGLSAVVGLFIGWYQRYHGAMPRPLRGPREFRRVYVAYFAGLAVLAGLVAGAWVLVGHAAAVAVAFVGTVVGLYGYERAYAAAASRARERIG